MIYFDQKCKVGPIFGFAAAFRWILPVQVEAVKVVLQQEFDNAAPVKCLSIDGTWVVSGCANYLAMNVCRLVAVDDMLEKRADPSFQPPMAINTFRSGLIFRSSTALR